MTDQDFIDEVKKSMGELSHHAVTSNGDQFAIWFAVTFLDLEEGDVVNKYHIGSAGDEKADLGIVETFPTKMLIQCKYSDNPNGKTFGKNEIDEILNARHRIDTAPNDGNEKRRQFVQEYVSSKLPDKLIVVGFGKFTNLPHNNAIEYAKINNVQLYDFQRLKMEYIRIMDPASQKRPEAIDLPKLDQRYFICNRPGSKNDDVVYAIIPTQTIYELVDQIGDGIFEENLRNQLPKARVSSIISSEIKKTLDNPDSLEFLIFNNGITFITEKIISEKEKNYFKLIKPQIINGCQTAYSIYDFYDTVKTSGADMSKLVSYVQVKLIETDVTDVQRNEKIARAANLQNPITPRDKYSTDELQRSLRSSFGNFTPKILYDNKNGLWESVLRNNKQSLYKVPHAPGKAFRILNNQLVGQLYLSLLGKPNIAGNQKGIVFSDEKYYNAVFDNRLSEQVRFPNIGISVVDAKLKTGENHFIKDTLFAFRVYKLLEAIELVLYPKKKSQYKDDPNNPNYEYYTKVATKEFVAYWHFHVIRLMHEIIFQKAKGKEDEIEALRSNLVTDEVDLFFRSSNHIANLFNIEPDPAKYTILHVSNPSKEFALFARWLSNLEQICYDVVSPERQKPDWAGFNQFFNKREESLRDLRKKVTDVLGGVDADLKFPSTIVK